MFGAWAPSLLAVVRVHESPDGSVRIVWSVSRQVLVVMLVVVLLLQPGCAASGSPEPAGPDLMETAEWGFVPACAVDEVGDSLPAHITVVGSRFEWIEVGETRPVRGAAGRLVVFCARTAARSGPRRAC